MKVIYKGEGTNCEERVCEIVGVIGHNMTRVRFENGDTVFVENDKLIFLSDNKEEVRKQISEYSETRGLSKTEVQEDEMSEPKDPINPSHYKQGIEVYDFIKSHDMNFAQGNAIKYISRYNLKNGVEDLKKAKWYIEALIKELESEEK